MIALPWLGLPLALCPTLPSGAQALSASCTISLQPALPLPGCGGAKDRFFVLVQVNLGRRLRQTFVPDSHVLCLGFDSSRVKGAHRE